MDFLLALTELFSLGVTAEALRAIICSKQANLPCTEMCKCMDTDELCANTAAHQESDASGEDEEKNDECDDDEDSEDTYFD